jgi:hypothetical protein
LSFFVRIYHQFWFCYVAHNSRLFNSFNSCCFWSIIVVITLGCWCCGCWSFSNYHIGWIQFLPKFCMFWQNTAKFCLDLISQAS